MDEGLFEGDKLGDWDGLLLGANVVGDELGLADGLVIELLVHP